MRSAADIVSKAAEAAAKEAGATPASVAAVAAAKKTLVDARVRIAAMSVHDKARDYLDNPYDDESVRAAIDRTVSRSENQPSYRAVRFVADLLIAELNNGVEPVDVVAGVDAKTEEISSDISDAVNSVARAAKAEGSRTPSEIQPPVSDIYDAASDVVSGLDRNSPGYHAATLVLGNVTGSNAEEAARSARNAARALRDQALASQSAAQERFRDLSTCASQCRAGIIDDYNDCPVSLLDCSVLGVSCSGNVDCCSGSCESGACLDPNAATCGSEGQVCCNGDLCNGDLVCSSGSCQVAVVCGSEGQACCNGDLCNGDLVCSSGSCQVAVVCGSEGQACCNGDLCNGDLVCSSGSCQVAVVCGSEGQACCTSGAACVSGFECVSGTCQVSCGAEGQQCCTSGSQCTGDLVCADSGTATTCQQCGSGGQVCCSNRACNENFECTGQGTGTCVGDCGSQGQGCCSGDSECGTDLACVTSGDDRTCQSCGQNEQACCTTGDECRESGLECSEGTCVEVEECGSEDQVCCAGDTCGSDLECESGTCQVLEECGSEDQVCCSRNRCDSDLECESGTCREIECGYEDQDCCFASTCVSGLVCRLGACKEIKGCGSEGNVCCRGGKCDSDFECVDNLCEMPEVVVEFVQHFSLGTLTPGLNTLLDVNESGIPFSSIQFTVSNEVSDARLNVTSRPEVPAGISGGPVGVQSYSYVTIASEGLSNENISSVSAKFSVDKDFFSGFSPSQIRMFEYNPVVNAWNKLDDPIHLSEDDDNHYFSVVTGGLTGDFAIALEKFVSCAHKDSAGGMNRYSIELTYSWEDSPTVNHKVVGELSADTPR